MEKVEQNLDAEETTLLVRNSRNGDDTKILAKFGVEVNGGVTNEIYMRNTYRAQPKNGDESEHEELTLEESDTVLENGAETINGEEKIEESDRVLENGAEAINGEKNSKENLVFHDKLEGLGVRAILPVWKTQIVEGPATAKYNSAAFQSKGGSIRYNQHEEEVEENGVSSSYVEPRDSSSQEGVNSTSTYTIKEPILKEPAKYNFVDFQSKGGSRRYNPHEEKVEENGSSSSNVEPPDTSSQEDVNSTPTFTISQTILKGPVRYNFSTHDPAIQSNSASITNNQHEEEVEENGVSSSNVEPPDSSLPEGVNSTPTFTISQTILKGPVRYNFSSRDPAIEFNGASAISNQYEEAFENGISSSNVQHSGNSSQEGRTSYEPSKEIESAEMEVINKDDLEITELDVERVIQKQTTHDLYCPNCKSCITKRVILSKRKRRVRISNEVDKRPKTGIAPVGTVPPDDQVHQGGDIGNEEAQTPAIDADEPYRGPAIFRCLSCFSIFIPTRNGFRFFRSAGGENGEENVQNEQAPDIKKNWLSIIFSKPNRQKTRFEEGSSSEANLQQVSSSIPSSDLPRESGQVLEDTDSPARASEILEGTAEKTAEHEGRDLTLPDLDHPKLPLLVDDTESDVLAVDQQMESKPSPEVHSSQDNDVNQLPTSSPSGWTVGDADGKFTISVPIPLSKEDITATIVTTNTVDNRNADSRNSENGDVYPAKGPNQMTNTTKIKFSHNKPPRTGAAPAAHGSSSVANVQQVSSSIPSSDLRESGQVLEDTDSPARASEILEGTTKKTAEHEGRDLTLPDLDHLMLPLLVDDTKSDELAIDQQMESKPSPEVHTSQDNDVNQLPTSSPSGWTVGDADGKFTISVPIPLSKEDITATIVTTNTVDNGNADSRSSENGDVYPAEGPNKMTNTTKIKFSHKKPPRTGAAPAAHGDETRIDIHTPLLPCTDEGVIPLIVPVPQLGTHTSTADREGLGAREERTVEVIKSIVYGGLAEIMTSLSVVSSAAGGGAATLNVLTLGAANLIGGLFIIAHNLWDLRCDRVEEQLTNQVTEQADRYRQLLGRRQNFALHAVLAIMSYIVFGLVPPVVYGFSFCESDDKQLKLLMVAAASLVCILVLTVGKVYVQRPQKSYFKTVMTFLVLGVSVSGVSYATGGLVERLLEKLGLFEPSSAAPNLVGPGMRPVGSGWASY